MTSSDAEEQATKAAIRKEKKKMRLYFIRKND